MTIHIQVNLPFRAICVNDKDRPEGFPVSKWIKKDHEYTVVQVTKMAIQGGQGFVLAEIDMTGCDPYKFFASWRFVPVDNKPIEEIMEELAI